LLSHPISTPRPFWRSISRARLIALAAIAATLASCAPFLVCRIPALIDYPNHLARMFILSQWDSIPGLQKFYLPEWAPLPNIGMDAVVVPILWLTHWPAETVLRDFTMIAVALTVPAAMLLSYAFHRRWSLWSVASLLFAYNYVLLYGFINYVAGIDLALICAALWMLYGNRNPLRAALIFAPAALALFFVHLYAFAVYGLIIGGGALWQLVESGAGDRIALLKRQAVGFLQFLPPLLVFFILSPMAGNAALSRIKLSTPSDKAMALYSVLDIGHRGPTLLSFAAFGAVLAYGFATKRLILARPGMAVLALLGTAFLVLPFTLFGSGFADFRLPIVGALVFVAATRWENVPPRTGTIMACGLAVLALTRIAVVAVDWRQGDARYDAIVHAMAPMEDGKRLLGYVAAEDATMDFARRPPIEHAAELAVLEKHAFVPTVFAEPQKQPMEFQPKVAKLAFADGIVPLYSHAFAARGPLAPTAVAPYDYVLIFAKTPLRLPIPVYLRRIDDGSTPDLALFAVINGSQAGR
jgi:hypothetical protein